MRASNVYDSIICFGDSLTQQASQKGGFVASLQDLYQRRLDVVSRGFSGYTSRQGLQLCPKLFESSEGRSAKLAIIWFGTNDSVSPGSLQYVPVEEYIENMRKIVGYFADTDVLLVTPATVVPGLVHNHPDDKTMTEYGQALASIAEQASEKRSKTGVNSKVEVVNMQAPFIEAAARTEGGLSSLLTDDGLHISQAGYEVVFETIRDAIFRHFPHLHPDRIPFTFPHWEEAIKQGSIE